MSSASFGVARVCPVSVLVSRKDSHGYSLGTVMAILNTSGDRLWNEGNYEYNYAMMICPPYQHCHNTSWNMRKMLGMSYTVASVCYVMIISLGSTSAQGIINCSQPFIQLAIFSYRYDTKMYVKCRDAIELCLAYKAPHYCHKTICMLVWFWR